MSLSNGENINSKIQLFYKDWNEIATYFYKYWQQNGRETKILPFIKKNENHFLGNYILIREFFKNIHPYNFLKEGNNAIQIGFHDQYIENGISHPFIIKSVIGKLGKIWAIDPDPINIKSAISYCTKNNVEKFYSIESGVWEEPGKKDFIFFSDYTSSNTISPIFEERKKKREKRWGEKRIKENTSKVSVKIDTLDNIIGRNSKDDKIDLINITTNGAETEILNGAKETIQNNDNIKITFPLGNISNKGLDYLSEMGFRLAISNSPHRPWEDEQFFYACAIRESTEKLVSRGYRKVNLDSYMPQEGSNLHFIINEKKEDNG